MNELKLKKCPFCGGLAEIVDNSRYIPGTYFVTWCEEVTRLGRQL